MITTFNLADRSSVKIFGSKMGEQEENILLRDVSNSIKVNDQPSRLSIFAIFSLFFKSSHILCLYRPSNLFIPINYDYVCFSNDICERIFLASDIIAIYAQQTQ